MTENNRIQVQINQKYDVVKLTNPNQQLNESIRQATAFLSGKETLKGYTNATDLEKELLDN